MHILITKKHTNLQICYIAAHSNIQLNKIADSAAKKAAIKSSIELILSPEHMKFQHDLRSYIHSLWQDDYTKINPYLPPLSTTSTLPLFSSSISPTGPLFPCYIYSRLRSGTTLLAHSLHKQHLYPSGLCSCGSPQILSHLLLDTTCSSFAQLRYEYLHSLTMHKIPLTIPAILNSQTALTFTVTFICSTVEYL